MEQSTRGVQSNFRGGTVPHSAFGYFVGTNQSYKKTITSMSDDFSCNSFRANVHHHTVLRPGEIILCPPAYLLSLYVQAVERQNSKDSTMECSYDLENCLSTNKNGFSRATRYGSAVAATDCPPIVREAGKDFSKSIQR